ncbi:DUF1697 domain-containing protein [Pseudomonas seleniipraecipitans]|uniref:DUF1697 domain-containing protein n=1 Tax=Phytopseudomonas seleniipraecipitans TaxID=640205 RepID=A0ABY5J6E3_9GAMM|nr:DUF1697 domain-containing protein [Pseudomonas seleniipraecipitans]UUD63646.1 DUF1697 domain-containing protein [Pseudomonas seleniipraecipitans]
MSNQENMALRVALMRSVVINGQRVKMVDARALAERVGAIGVQSVIATGNLLFHSGWDNGTLQRMLQTECESFYGQSTEIVLRTAEQWRELISANPFPNEAASQPSRLLVWIMREPISDSGIHQLRQRAVGAERIERTPQGDFFVWFGETSIPDSRIPAGFSIKSLGAIGTNRNWNTVNRISEVLEKMEAARNT